MADFALVTSRNGGTVRLELAGELDLAVVAALNDEIDRWARSGAVVELDLAGLRFIDSTGLHALGTAHVRAQQEGWTCRVVALSPAVERLVALTGYGRLLSPNRDEPPPGPA